VSRISALVVTLAGELTSQGQGRNHRPEPTAVAQRWRVGARSCTWWGSLQDLYTNHIYAHPEYGTRIEWSDGKVEDL
jgi:hypothetical protein